MECIEMMSTLSSQSTAAAALRPRTMFEVQPQFLAYSTAITFVSPFVSFYHVLKLNPHVKVPFTQLGRHAVKIFPSQAAIRAVQISVVAPIKDNLNHWFAFAALGILQGISYGHANTYLGDKLGILRSTNRHLWPNQHIRGLFRGVGFAGVRDSISQGVPFMFSTKLREKIFDKVIPTTDSTPSYVIAAKKWTAVIATSVCATYLSQALHNFATTMQTNHLIGYFRAVEMVTAQHGIAMFYRGAEARAPFLICINILNELILRPAWAGVPVSE